MSLPIAIHVPACHNKDMGNSKETESSRVRSVALQLQWRQADQEHLGWTQQRDREIRRIQQRADRPRRMTKAERYLTATFTDTERRVYA